MANEKLFSGLHFLIAEDHAFQRAALAWILEGAGAATIHAAADGQAALALLRAAESPIDIVICDLQMPGSDGLEFLRLLRGTGARASVIVVSALEPKLLESIATMAQAYGIKLLGVIEKPVTPAKLKQLVERHQPLLDHRNPVPALRFTVEEIAAGLRRGEFEPFFQPKIELVTGKVKGAEALARWRHPVHGIVEPAAFLSLCEESGLIGELTSSMLEQAVQWCDAWRTDGVEPCVSVNLSARTLGDGKIADHLAGLMQRHRLTPDNMILEVTESAAMIDVGPTLEALARLRMTGFGLSIDDYGTGYSSMLQLTRVAFTELKIDRSFVVSATMQPAARVILASCIDMARKLDMTSVAEGVETQEHIDLLLELGCDMAQGYFFTRPMPASAYPDWVRSREQSARYAGRSPLRRAGATVEPRRPVGNWPSRPGAGS